MTDEHNNDDVPAASDEQHRQGREILLAAYDRLVESGEHSDDPPLASDEAHAELYELLCEASDKRKPEELEGGAASSAAPPDPTE